MNVHLLTGFGLVALVLVHIYMNRWWGEGSIQNFKIRSGNLAESFLSFGEATVRVFKNFLNFHSVSYIYLMQ